MTRPTPHQEHPVPDCYLRPPPPEAVAFVRQARCWAYVVVERGKYNYVTTGFSDAPALQAYLRHARAHDGTVFLGVLHVDRAWFPTGPGGRQDLADLLREDGP